MPCPAELSVALRSEAIDWRQGVSKGTILTGVWSAAMEPTIYSTIDHTREGKGRCDESADQRRLTTTDVNGWMDVLLSSGICTRGIMWDQNFQTAYGLCKRVLGTA